MAALRIISCTTKSRVAVVIDLKLLREDPDRVRASQRARGEDPGLVDALLQSDAARRSAISAADKLRAEQKAASRAVGQASADERPTKLALAKELAERVKSAESEQAAAEVASNSVRRSA
jgi:seryl-tRNA synthetase